MYKGSGKPRTIGHCPYSCITSGEKSRIGFSSSNHIFGPKSPLIRKNQRNKIFLINYLTNATTKDLNQLTREIERHHVGQRR